MSRIVVERSFDSPADMDALRAREEQGASCSEARDVVRRYSVRSLDGLHVACLYDAPDTEAVRDVYQKAQLPFDRIWSASVRLGEGVDALQPRRERVIVQRDLPMVVTLEEYAALGDRAADCMMRHRARLLEAYLSADGRIGLCHFEGVDAESVRVANEESEVPFARAWTAVYYPGP